jgi:hypothetical protein
MTNLSAHSAANLVYFSAIPTHLITRPNRPPRFHPCFPSLDALAVQQPHACRSAVCVRSCLRRGRLRIKSAETNAMSAIGLAVRPTGLQSSRRPTRRAAAAAELAICLPLIISLALASIEACSMIFLDHSLTIASYEGVRVAINYDATNASVLARCNQIISNREVQGATISISPANVAAVDRGTPIAITVTAPCNDNMIIPPWFYGGRTLTSTTTMVKE